MVVLGWRWEGEDGREEEMRGEFKPASDVGCY